MTESQAPHCPPGCRPRGGDRRANSAPYIIVLTRLGRDRRTREYANRRTTQGKSTKETIRCLKRYVAREPMPRS